MLNPIYYPYAKALHLLAIICWMAGIFYLPRIFVHYVEGKTANEDVRRLKVMAKRLYHFTSMMAVFSLASGLWLWLGFGFSGGWIHAKLGVVALLIAYHLSTRYYMKRMQRDDTLPSAKVLRWYNEAPLLLIVAILWLVVLKPF